MAKPPLTIETLTPAERRGFVFACQSLQLWAAQIERNAAGLSGAGQVVPLDEMLARNARMSRHLAETMELAATL